MVWNTFARAVIRDIQIGMFGGREHGTDARVLDADGAPMPGLYPADELIGGILYFNDAGGSGLPNGTVFGRLADTSAARS